VVGLEYPERWGGLIDVGCALDARAIERFVAALGSPQDEDQMALRSAGLFVRRLVTAPLGDAVASRTFEPRGTVLVTGATGSLGVHIARWLARGGATHLVLTSRRGAAAPGAAELEAELTALGARVTFAACDVADRQALAALIERVEAEGAPIRSVFHVAGVVSLVKPLSATTIAEFASVVAGKDAGAQHLHHLFSDKPLHAFVLFSSITGVWGSGYQCAYSAANAYLDALAEHRRGLGLVATSMQWGPWAGKAHEEHQHQLERRGFHLMETEPALVGLEQALAHDETTISVVDIDWGLFAPAYAMARARPLLRDLPAVQRALKAPEEVSAARTTSDRKRTGELRQRLLSVEPGRRRRDMLVQHCQLEVGRVLKLDPRRVDITAPLASMGFDSVMSLELKKRLEAVLDVDLPSTLAWRFPTVEALVPFLAERVGISLEAPAEVVVQPPAAAEQVEAADLEDLSEAEVEALLLKKLEKLGGV
jgi:NADP-dependent 3-hydroxy acid dehydrogenase YdfG/acyl carrier protein